VNGNVVMLRRLFTIFSALSLLLCITAAGVTCAWRSHEDTIRRRGVDRRVCELDKTASEIEERLKRLSKSPNDQSDVIAFNDPIAVLDRQRIAVGREHEKLSRYASSSPAALLNGSEWNAYLLLMLTTGIYSIARLAHWICIEPIRLLRVRGLNNRVCASCGYDLRGTPHRCPECGEVPS